LALKSYLNKNLIEAGCDEAGRGCLAGPVFAAAVILPKNFRQPLLNDSKQLSKSIRSGLRLIIEEKALAWSVAIIDQLMIDEINILNASILAMNNAALNLSLKPEHLLIDGNRFNSNHKIPYTCIIKGDGKFSSIAAASILAKEHRDDFMMNLHQKYPIYGWDTNVGYPTVTHRKNIVKYGPCEYHRKSFQLYPTPKQIQLFE